MQPHNEMESIMKCIRKMLMAVFAVIFMMMVQTAWADETAAPASDEQRDRIMALADVWMPEDGQHWDYIMTDLDHNGRSEVICASMQGTGHFTYAQVFELAPDGYTLVPVTGDPYENLTFPDIGCSECVCYHDVSADQYHYVFTDIMRNGYAELYNAYVALTLHDGALEDRLLASMSDLYDADGKETLSYYDAAGKPITEEEYNSAADRIFAGMEKYNVILNWNTVPQRGVRAEEVSADGIIVHVTKNPTGECLPLYGSTWFIAHADNAASLEWELVSPWGERLSLADAMSRFPGVELEALEGDTLAVRNVSEEMNGWAVIARFTNGAAYAVTDPAYLYIGDYVHAYEAVLAGYRALAAGAENGGIVQWTDLELRGVSLGYRLKDLDRDGSPEMIVAQRRPDGTCGAGDIIYGVYTLRDGIPQEVFHSWARNRYYYIGNGFLNEGSGGASQSDWYLITVSYGYEMISEGLYTDGDRPEIYFRVKGGDRYSALGTAISETEFNKMIDMYESYFLPLGQLTVI